MSSSSVKPVAESSMRRLGTSYDDVVVAFGPVNPPQNTFTCILSRLVLQRQSGEWVATSFVVAGAGLVLSSAAEA
jgi:hypothetical protein